MTTLSGILQAPDGTAIAGAKITFEAVRNYSEVTYHSSSTIVTGVDGSYSLDLSIGTYNVFINYGKNRIITVGVVTILQGSADGTLNQYLLANNDPVYVQDVLSQLAADGGVELVNGAAALISVPNFASLPVNAFGLYVVQSDETKNGDLTIYLMMQSKRYWVAAIEEL